MKTISKVLTTVLLATAFTCSAQAASHNMYRAILEDEGQYGNDCMAAAKAAATVTYRISVGHGVPSKVSGAIFPELDGPNRISVKVNATSQSAKTYVVDVNQTAQACEIKAIVEK